MLKLNSTGDVIWQKTYGGLDRDVYKSIQQTTDDGYILAGDTKSFGAGFYDNWVLKLDSNGNVIWQKTYGGMSDDYTSSIQQTADGGYVVAGRIYGDSLVIKLDTNGNVTWQKGYGGIDSDAARFIQQITGGGYILAGDTESFGAGGYDNWVLKLDSNGNVIWQKTYGGSYDDFAFAIRETLDGGFILTGSYYFTDAWVLKLDGNGEIPGCEIIGVTDATVFDTNFEIQNTDASIQVTNATIYIPNALPQHSSAILSIMCCYDTDDYDEDGLFDACDNCPDNFNPEQNDYDEDGTGDICDECTDTDRDGYGNPGFSNNACILDNCPSISNPDQLNSDDDSYGNLCDNCPEANNENQSDSDSDGAGDTCDNCLYQPNGSLIGTCTSGNILNPCTQPGYNTDQCGVCGYCVMDQADSDTDGWGDACDTCPSLASFDQTDGDDDGVGDMCDNCPDIVNHDQRDSDGDCTGDACDVFPDVFDPLQLDSDDDSIGDICDSNPFVPAMFPVADGHYYYFFDFYDPCGGCPVETLITEIRDMIKVSDAYWKAPGIGSQREIGLMEFDISNMNDTFSSGQMEAALSLTVKCGGVLDNNWIELYSIEDNNENGIIEENDIVTDDYVGFVSTQLQPGKIITFEDTSALENDLFNPAN